MNIDPLYAGSVAAIVGGCGMLVIFIILIIVVVILIRYHDKLEKSTQIAGAKDAYMYGAGQAGMSQLTLVNATSTLSFQSSDEHLANHDLSHVNSQGNLGPLAAELFSHHSDHDDFQPIQISVSKTSKA